MNAVANKPNADLIDTKVEAVLPPASQEEHARCQQIVADSLNGPSYIVPVDEDHPVGVRHAWEITPGQLMRSNDRWGYGICEPARLVLAGQRWELDYSGLNEAQVAALKQIHLEEAACNKMISEAGDLLRLWYCCKAHPIEPVSDFAVSMMRICHTRASHESLVYFALILGYSVPEEVINSYPDLQTIVGQDPRPWRVTDYPGMGNRARHAESMQEIADSIERSLEVIAQAEKGKARCKSNSSDIYRNWERQAERAMQSITTSEIERSKWEKYIALCELEDAEEARRKAAGETDWRQSPIMPEFDFHCKKCGLAVPDLLLRDHSGECDHLFGIVVK